MPETKKCPYCHVKPSVKHFVLGMSHHQCDKCGFTSPAAQSDNESRLNWNRSSFSKPMSSPASKGKGSDFEREMCKQLSLWLSKGETDDLLWRNKGQPNRKVKGVRRLEQFGDMHSIGEKSVWFMNAVNVELKFYKNLDLLELMDKPNSKGRLIEVHWKQCRYDAGETSRTPLLISKRNFGVPFCITTPGWLGSWWQVCILGELLAVFPLSALLEADPDHVRSTLEDEAYAVPGRLLRDGVGEIDQARNPE